MIEALVNVRERKVVGLRAIRSVETPITPLSAVEKRKAIKIARANARVQEILDSGAEIRSVIPLPFFKPSESSLTVRIVGVVLLAPASVSQVKGAPESGGQRWIIVVDLNRGKVVRLTQTTPRVNPGAYTGSGSP